MKKFFYVLMAAATLAAVSCDKEGNNGNEGEEGNGTGKRKVLLALPSQINDNNELVSGRSFRYNEDGTLAGVDEVWTNDDGSLGKYNLNVTREGNKLTLVSDDGEVAYEWTVNEKGYVVKNGNYSYEYDAEDHLTKVIEDWGEGPQVVSICTWENGNMTSWTKEDEQGGAEKDPRMISSGPSARRCGSTTMARTGRRSCLASITTASTLTAHIRTTIATISARICAGTGLIPRQAKRAGRLFSAKATSSLRRLTT